MHLSEGRKSPVRIGADALKQRFASMVRKKKSGPEKARKRLMRLAFRQTHLYRFVNMEVTPRFELGNEGFADPCLTTWLCHHIRETAFRGRFSVWSGRRGSNSLPRPWQGRALPDELRPHMAPVFQHHGASGRSRTNDTRIFSPLLYQLSYRGKWRPRWGSNPRPPA